MSLDLSNQYQWSLAKAPAAVTSDGDGTAVDLRDCGPDVLALILVGAVTGTTPTCTVAVQSSLNDNTASAEAAADAYATISGATASLTEADANSLVKISTYKRDERYVRLDFDVGAAGGSTPSFTIGAVIGSRKISY